MIAEEPFISLQNVRKVYRSKGAEFLAVSDVTMDVKEGELVSLVGPSGCGKTTVLKILAGLHDADGGTVKIGNSKTPFDPARDIGMVFQQALLLKWRTIHPSGRSEESLPDSRRRFHGGLRSEL